ncbi:hypothetical protein COS91_01550 [Candidatus Desantisbacteria bacterium CG07_land_8_20_14_0_80_39_15]|uniref:Terminase large subunit gp17-like C-terminal domain-containing protein n=1 Tax=Candidatus Desantisbacteria bacterium CG07_land_8_20_14_0_80_39_15 TaxID=1974549 RepID=A0A2M6ZHY8_9BACT|nr:MAG: hypothetical protein COS91_01550 [Candidatus Desantisbacteria bacterium CG07_land_8_20_14_0_80_39_15]
MNDQLAWLIKNPIRWFEFWNDLDPFDFQKRISIRYKTFQFYHLSAARGVGKTKTFESDITRECFDNTTREEKELLFTTPNKAHLSPTMDRIILKIESVPFLRNQVERILRAPDFLVQFKNKAVLHSRVAGFSGGKTFFGLHPDVVWVDEGQIFTTKPMEQLQGCLKPKTKVRVSGVPNDVRKSYLYKTINEDSFFKESVITKFDRPDYTQEQDDFLAKMYGGHSSFMYKTQVMAEWSKVARDLTFATRALDLMANWDYEDYKIINLDYEPDQKIDFEYIDIPEPLDKLAPIVIASDIGYSPDPTIIGLFNNFPDKGLRLFGKYVLTGVIYSQQEKLFEFLIDRFPGCTLALDEGGPGKSVALDLSNYGGTPFTFVPVGFGNSVVLGKTPDDDKEVKQRIKIFSTLKLEQAMIEGRLKIPSSDFALIDEAQNSTKSMGRDNTVVYSGIDHHLDMLRCAVISDILPQLENMNFNSFDFRMIGD